jgi:hypothetical protein
MPWYEFEKLTKSFLNSFENFTFEGKVRERAGCTKRAPAFCLLLTLLWLRQYPVLAWLEALFGIHQRTIAQILKRSIAALDACEELTKFLKLPSEEDLQECSAQYERFLADGLSNVGRIMDGSQIPVQTPSVPFKIRKKMWSGHHHRYCLNILYLTNPEGMFIYCGKAVPGSNDQRELNSSGLRELLAKSNFATLTDKGFTISRACDPIKLPQHVAYKKHKGVHLGKEVRNYNKNCGNTRVIIENAFARLKKWKVLAGKYRHFHFGRFLDGKEQLMDIDKIVSVCVKLTNKDLLCHPLRRAGWEVTSKKLKVHGRPPPPTASRKRRNDR